MKKLIKKYLKKHLTAHPKHYHFLRWLSEFVMDKESLKDVCYSIAGWVYTSNSKLYMYLNDILVIDNIVYIYTMRPGLWIGKGGKTIDECKHYINHNRDDEKIHDYSIRLIEIQNTPYSTFNSALYSYANNW